MAASVALDLAGEPMVLFAERALFWPRRARLLIADLHLGKTDAFRRAGIGLPRGGTAHDLARLTALVEATGARELWILGDVLHGAVRGEDWQQSWHDWRARHPQLALAALAGNHDRALAGAGLGLALLGEAVDDPPFAFRHEPTPHPRLHVVCGHVHPVLALPGSTRRWPVFWLRAGMIVLPAFAAFTGGWAIALNAGERAALCGPDAIALLPG
ncbi:MAG TPA: ligase-associated DNA damage response endonuclease PdeM [Lysobacter sp.]|nr:ligase-associated DNA damage response endonuclease PdeM [Lysobacter sp.]